MTSIDSQPGYSRLQIILHWVVFLLIAQQYLFKDGISSAWEQITTGGEASISPLVLAHVLGGGLVMLMALWRLRLRAKQGVAQTAGGGLLDVLAKLVHVGLYLLMLLMPLSGSVAWFLGVEVAAQGHNVMKVALLALVALHVLGALFHQFILRDGTLDKMRKARG